MARLASPREYISTHEIRFSPGGNFALVTSVRGPIIGLLLAFFAAACGPTSGTLTGSAATSDPGAKVVATTGKKVSFSMPGTGWATVVLSP